MSEPTAKCIMDMEQRLEQCLENGVCISFNLPKKGLALSSVSIVDGVPVLYFKASNSTELTTLTEDDVAAMARLVVEKKRPEFFYIAIPPNHPFSGRQYKLYSPQWLRGLPLGDTLAELDWKMKCLTIGAKTNEDKTEFRAASMTSKLEGQLGTMMNFPRDQTHGSVKMSCKSIKVEKTNDDLVFIGEPKMQIVSDASPEYTKYITEIFDSVAYYDEPVFMRMQEVTKLIVAMEFLHERGVRFDREWFMEKTANRNKMAVCNVNEDSNDEALVEKVNKLLSQQFPECSSEVTKITKSGMKFREMDETESTVAVSVHDYNMLYKGCDPKQPIVKFDDDFIVPDVDSWSELHKETVPWPRVWHIPHKGQRMKGLRTAGGGITTRNIPTTQVPIGTSSRCKTRVEKDVKNKGQYEYCNKLLSVSSSSIRSPSVPQKPHKDMIPSQQNEVHPPKQRVGPTSSAVTAKGSTTMYGYQDEDGLKVFNQNGQKCVETESIKFVAQKRDENGEMQQRVAKLIALDSGISSMIEDDVISEKSDATFFSTLDGSTPQYDFLSPLGSGDELD